MTDIHEKLRKLAALAANGVGGERENAEVIFTRLLQTNGLSREDFLSPDTKETLVWFKFESEWEGKLLTQISVMVTDRRASSHYTDRKAKTKGVTTLDRPRPPK